MSGNNTSDSATSQTIPSLAEVLSRDDPGRVFRQAFPLFFVYLLRNCFLGLGWFMGTRLGGWENGNLFSYWVPAEIFPMKRAGPNKAESVRTSLKRK